MTDRSRGGKLLTKTREVMNHDDQSDGPLYVEYAGRGRERSRIQESAERMNTGERLAEQALQPEKQEALTCREAFPLF